MARRRLRARAGRTSDARIAGSRPQENRLKYRPVNGPPDDRRFNKVAYTINEIDRIFGRSLKSAAAIDEQAEAVIDELRDKIARNEDISPEEFRVKMGAIATGLSKSWDGRVAAYGANLLYRSTSLKLRQERHRERLAAKANETERKVKGIEAIAAAHRRAKRRKEKAEQPWLKDHDKGLSLQ